MKSILSHYECKQIVATALELSSCQNFEIQYDVHPVSSEVLGFMGEYYKLQINVRIDNDSEKTLKCFIKIIPTKNKVLRKECIDKGFFQKEVGLYSDILVQIQNIMPKQMYPKCYYNRPDMLVLEDLFDKGYTHMASDQKYTMAFIETVLQNMSSLHAASIAIEINTGTNIGEKYKNILIELQLTNHNTWCTVGLKSISSIAKIHPKYQTKETQQFIEEKLWKYLENGCNVTNPSETMRNTLCHRDTWDKNVFYKLNANGHPIDCLFVDFQLTRYHPPALDVLFFLYIVTNKEQRHQYMEESLQFYYANLIKNFKDLGISVDTITWEEFCKSCDYVKVGVLILKAICTPLIEMPKGLANQMRADDPVKFNEYMNADRDEMIFNIMKLNTNYKNSVYETVEELVDYLLTIEVL